MQNNDILARMKEVELMLALSTNLIGFYLAAVLFERTGVLCAVTVFLVTAIAGTVISSKIEDLLTSLLARAFKRRGNDRRYGQRLRSHSLSYGREIAINSESR